MRATFPGGRICPQRQRVRYRDGNSLLKEGQLFISYSLQISHPAASGATKEGGVYVPSGKPQK